jgi:MEDS: MEthanogen/methylotroph, DcmR Sensory domain
MNPSQTANWRELLQGPSGGDHFVQVYKDEAFLFEAVTEYVETGLRRGEGVVIIATPSHRAVFVQQLEDNGVAAEEALQHGQLLLLDADETLARFTTGGMPEWQSFRTLIGGVIAKLRLEYPTVRAYGEMVDLLWQRGEREAAIRLEEFWNDLAGLQTFSLLCAYYLDNLDQGAYSGPLDCICRVHSHLIAVRDYKRFNEAVVEASEAVLDQTLAQMLLSLSQRHRPRTAMPQGQATLLWLQHNMPRTAEKVLAQVRSRYSA